MVDSITYVATSDEFSAICSVWEAVFLKVEFHCTHLALCAKVRQTRKDSGLVSLIPRSSDIGALSWYSRWATRTVASPDSWYFVTEEWDSAIYFSRADCFTLNPYSSPRITTLRPSLSLDQSHSLCIPWGGLSMFCVLCQHMHSYRKILFLTPRKSSYHQGKTPPRSGISEGVAMHWSRTKCFSARPIALNLTQTSPPSLKGWICMFPHKCVSSSSFLRWLSRMVSSYFRCSGCETSIIHLHWTWDLLPDPVSLFSSCINEQGSRISPSLFLSLSLSVSVITRWMSHLVK